MSYHHRNKVGNQGDLIKHFALCSAIHHYPLRKDHFSYLDVHAGQADYLLQNNGAWIRGIGAFAQRYPTAAGSHQDLDYFYRLLALKETAAGTCYPGSSMILRRVLLDRKIKDIHLHLCDIDTEVCASLQNSYRAIDHTHVYCEDGYRKAKQLTDLDLVFIDPPDMDEHFPAYMDLLHYCLHRGQPFISWNSLHGNAAGDNMSAACQQIGKLARTTDTAQLTVKWHPGWPGAMCGCQMLFGLPGAAKLPASCQSLARLMQWAIIP